MRTSTSIAATGLLAVLALVATRGTDAQGADASTDKPQSTAAAVRAKPVLNPGLNTKPAFVLEDPVVKELKAHVAALEKRHAATEERMAALEARLAKLEPVAYDVANRFPAHTHPYKIRTWGQTTAANIYMHGKAGIYVPIPTVDKGGTLTRETAPPAMD